MAAARGGDGSATATAAYGAWLAFVTRLPDLIEALPAILVIMFTGVLQ